HHGEDAAAKVADGLVGAHHHPARSSRRRVMDTKGAEIASRESPPPSSADTRMVFVTTAAWFLVAYGAGSMGLLRTARPPLPQVLIVGLTAAVLVLFWL